MPKKETAYICRWLEEGKTGFKVFEGGPSGHDAFPGELFASTDIAAERAKTAGFTSFRYPDGKFNRE